MAESKLKDIKSPGALRSMTMSQLQELCQEIRRELIDVVSANGGHLASNLGVVELTVALHRVFSSPRDSFVFDVGHQAYVHKLLTGRAEVFSTLRTEGGISGFPKPAESPHDSFIEGHCGAALSAAIGLARAKQLKGDMSKVVVVLGDGSFTNGMTYEAVNNIDHSLKNLIVVLNDNSMSISKSVGSVARYLFRLRTNSGYSKLKTAVEGALNSVPLVGKPLTRCLAAAKSLARRAIYDGVLFEELGFRYVGPVDGHDLPELVGLFSELNKSSGPMLVHVITSKGKGFQLAEENPGAYHGVGSFDIEKGNPDIAESDCFSNVFGRLLASLADRDGSICAITAAMKYGTGLNFFAHSHRERFFDVGIAEEHAVTFAAGLSKGGMRPVLSVYSTFLQRSFDQLYHDILLNRADLLLAVDRAGLVGSDGETHQGLMDVAMLTAIGGFTVVSPCNYGELRFWTEKLMQTRGQRAIRYPRGAEDPELAAFQPSGNPTDLIPRPGASALLVTYGRELAQVLRAARELDGQGISCDVMKLNVIWPLREEDITAALGYKLVFFAEEGVRSGGIGEHFVSRLYQQGYSGLCGIAAAGSAAVPQSELEPAMRFCGIDSSSIAERVREIAEQKNKA